MDEIAEAIKAIENIGAPGWDLDYLCLRRAQMDQVAAALARRRADIDVAIVRQSQRESKKTKRVLDGLVKKGTIPVNPESEDE